MIPFKEWLLISGLFATLFPQLAANNTQKINLEKMFAPGYWKGEPNLNGTVSFGPLDSDKYLQL